VIEVDNNSKTISEAKRSMGYYNVAETVKLFMHPFDSGKGKLHNV
jgi:hypothetical protein